MRSFIVVLILVLTCGAASAATTATTGTAVTAGSRGEREVYSPITLSADGSGGAVTDYAISDQLVRGMQLVEVEIIHGTSTAWIAIENSRDTEVWSLTAMDATENRIYGGHTRWGVFPKMDTVWFLSAGSVDADDTIVIWLKFSSKP